MVTVRQPAFLKNNNAFGSTVTVRKMPVTRANTVTLNTGGGVYIISLSPNGNPLINGRAYLTADTEYSNALLLAARAAGFSQLKARLRSALVWPLLGYYPGIWNEPQLSFMAALYERMLDGRPVNSVYTFYEVTDADLNEIYMVKGAAGSQGRHFPADVTDHLAYDQVVAAYIGQ